jgi:hypothetical protein
MTEEKPNSVSGAKAFLREVFARKLPHKFGGASVRDLRRAPPVYRETDAEIDGQPLRT